MSKQKKKTATKKQKTTSEPVIYVGPTIKGVLPTGTILNEGVPEKVTKIIEKCPSIKELIIPASKAGEAQKQIHTKKGSAYIFYCKVEAFL